MSRYSSSWLTLSIFALLVNVAWTDECLSSGLRPTPRDIKLPSDCLMDCTMRTFFKKQLLRHRPPIQFKDSTQGDHGTHCWSTKVECRVGSSVDRAFVVLPVNYTTAEQVEVTTSPAAAKLSVHPSVPLLSEGCGLLYDVTEHFTRANTESSFCISTVPVEGLLRCPPYLVIFWQTDSSLAHLQSGG